jgi:hypothetical protein
MNVHRLAVALVAGMAMFLQAAVVNAADNTTHLSEPFAFALDNPCTGEVIDLVGELDGVVTSSINPAGHIHLAEVHRITASGLSSSGIEYKYLQTSPDHLTLDVDGAPFTATGETTGLLISQGGTANLDQHVLFHLTIDANGDVTATVDNASVDCTG